MKPVRGKLHPPIPERAASHSAWVANVLRNVPGGAGASYVIKCMYLREQINGRLLAEMDAMHDDRTLKDLRRKLEPLHRSLLAAASAALSVEAEARRTQQRTPSRMPTRSMWD